MSSFWKKNERVLMVVFLVLLAPLFAFPLSSLAGSGRATVAGEPRFTVGEKVIDNQSFQLARRDLADFQRYSIARALGPLVEKDPVTGKVIPKPFPFGVPEESVQMFMLQELEAEKLGLVPSTPELKKLIVDFGTEMLIHYRIMKDFPELAPRTPEYSEKQTELRETSTFDAKLYVKMLGDREFLGDFSTVNRFESLLARQLSVMKLQSAILDSAVVTEKEIWEAYAEQNELRVFDFVRIERKGFNTQAQLEVTGDDERRAFNTYRESLRLPDRVRLEILKLDPSAIALTEDELIAAYEADKAVMYRDPSADPEAGEAEFKTLDEVRSSVERTVRNDKQTEILTAAIAAAEEKRAAGEDYTLLDTVADEYQSAATVLENTPVIGRTDVWNQYDPAIRTPRLQGLLFSNYGELEVGGVSEEPVSETAGAFIYRVVELLPNRLPEFEEVADEAASRAMDDKAFELLGGFVDDLMGRLEGEDAMELDELATVEALTMVRTEPLREFDGSKIQVDGTTVVGAAQVLQRGFGIEEPGSIVRVDAPDKSASFLLRFVESQEPGPEDYEAQRESIENRLLQEKRQETIEEYNEELRSKVSLPVTFGDGADGAEQ